MVAPVLLTGSTGYVGGHLLKRFQAEGRLVRCLVRNPDKLREAASCSVEVVQGDLLDLASVTTAMKGVETAYYLVHSMEADSSFERLESDSARNFSRAAREQGLKRIIYLGGLAHGNQLSPHLASRHRVGEIFRSSGVATIEFRASIIIGAGSISFDMVKALVTKLPVMTTPKWVAQRAQPIYIEDVLDYLIAAQNLTTATSEVFEIGGAEQVSYLEIMQTLSNIMGLRRIIVPVPVLTPWLSSLWLGLVTPVQAKVGRKLIEGVRNDSVVKDTKALTMFAIRPLGINQSLLNALSVELPHRNPRLDVTPSS